MKRIISKILPLYLVVFILLTSLSFSFDAEAGEIEQLPVFSTKSLIDGAIISEKTLVGKIVLVNFWATWCPPCRNEMATLRKLQELYGNKGFTVVALSVEKSSKVVRNAISQMKMNFPVALANKKTQKAFGGISGLPVSFLFSPSGRIMKEYYDSMAAATMEQDIAKAVAEYFSDKPATSEEREPPSPNAYK